ncbi:MAG: hydroxyacid dehydrogenase [Acidobacteriota bacterium]|nr:MAG: 3-phosphoglycerate dehydrogenase [Acidobacteriota bacterium]
MRILAADGLDERAIAALEADGHEVIRGTGGYAPEALIEALDGVDVLVVRSATKVPRAVLEARRDSLRLVIRAGSGLDSIDTDAARDLGVAVTNTPGLNAPGVAELAIGLMFAVVRRVGFAHAGMLAGRWEKKACKGTELAGKRLGVVGLGRIGARVAELGRAIGMDVVGHRRSPDRGGPVPLVDLDELFASCDVVSLHVPAGPETRNMVDAARLERVRRGQVIVNTARGDVLDLDACLAALEDGRLGGLGIDVWPVEPPPEMHPVVRHPAVVATPHIGAQTAESTARIGERVVELVRELASGG